MVTFLITISCS